MSTIALTAWRRASAAAGGQKLMPFSPRLAPGGMTLLRTSAPSRKIGRRRDRDGRQRVGGAEQVEQSPTPPGLLGGGAGLGLRGLVGVREQVGRRLAAGPVLGLGQRAVERAHVQHERQVAGVIDGHERGRRRVQPEGRAARPRDWQQRVGGQRDPGRAPARGGVRRVVVRRHDQVVGVVAAEHVDAHERLVIGDAALRFDVAHEEAARRLDAEAGEPQRRQAGAHLQEVAASGNVVRVTHDAAAPTAP